MKLTFDKELLDKLLEHSKNATERNRTYDEEGTDEPGLILVGDDGIYLMSNGKDGLPKNAEAAAKKAAGEEYYSRLVCYADQCNPDTMEFDDWYDAKRHIFGGDDGAMFLPASSLETMTHLDMNPARVKIYGEEAAA